MERAPQDSLERPWTSKVIAVGAAALAAIAIAVIVGAFAHRSPHRPLVMTAGTSSTTTATGPQSGAGAEAAEAAEVSQLVASVHRPPGATALAGCPTSAHQPIKALPRSTAATASRCWSVPDQPAWTVAWERHHPPAGTEPAGTVRAGGTDGAPRATGLLFGLGRQGGVEVSVYPPAHGAHGSVLRVDGYVRPPTTSASSVG